MPDVIEVFPEPLRDIVEIYPEFEQTIVLIGGVAGPMGPPGSGGGGNGEPVPGFYQGTGEPDDDMNVALGSTYLDISSKNIYRLD